ncbi:inositol transport system substrate-binding protein [Aequitasia blattaphilus]|uniref:Substrate-binding domain-containing protein n=1 Tax=Aequitasia blattaphilus TaxID=2949332 RepID=A0ABT1EB04_9FIRM|nr:substrate-binding domain-containing protein [Aequitasia blattaphilus]MCP1103013.1 substrate-binding domain-containing protein [Aequitasia blattaphilus]MCR8615653.1 substrate-binding domain-containing protein [Aequitasia blattaphilus]
MKKIIAGLLIVMMLMVMIIGCSEKNEEKSKKQDGKIDWSDMSIGWSPANLSNELQVALTDELTKELDALGAKLMTSDPQGDAVTQVEQVENYISRGVDMILMSPCDAAACGVVVDEAKEAGIPMIIVNCKMDNMDNALCYVGCDDTSAGEMLMEYAAEKIGEKGSIAILRGPDGLDAQIKRTAGIDNVLKDKKDIKVESTLAADWKTDKAMTTVENWLQTMNLNAVICENDEMAIGAVEAIKGQGLSCEEVKVFGIDGIDSAYESISKNEMTATLLQDAKAIANRTVEVVQIYEETGTVDKEYIIDWVIVDGTNINDYYTK